MMPKSLAVPLLLVLAALVPSVHADDACSEADPCEWVVEIDADGLAAPGGDLEGTVGDWYVFEFYNIDEADRDHTVTYSFDGSAWQIGGLSERTTEPFELTQEGTFELRDNVTGDTLPVQVVFGDVADGEAGTTTDGEAGESQPFTPVLWSVLALAALAVLMRRR